MMTDAAKTHTDDQCQKKKSLVFETVHGVVMGVGLAVMAGVTAEFLGSSWQAGRLKTPNPQAVARLMSHPEFGTRYPVTAPLIVAVSAADYLIRAISHNKRVDSFAELETKRRNSDDSTSLSRG